MSEQVIEQQGNLVSLEEADLIERTENLSEEKKGKLRARGLGFLLAATLMLSLTSEAQASEAEKSKESMGEEEKDEHKGIFELSDQLTASIPGIFSRYQKEVMGGKNESALTDQQKVEALVWYSQQVMRLTPQDRELDTVKRMDGTKKADDVERDKKGDCNELTYFLMGLGRSAGLTVQFAEVLEDEHGDEWTKKYGSRHAIALVTAGETATQVDLTKPYPHSVNPGYEKIRTLDDRGVLKAFYEEALRDSEFSWNHKKKIELILEYMDSFPEMMSDQRLLATLGESYFRGNNFTEAIRYLTDIERPTTDQLWFLGKSYQLVGNAKNAIAILERLLHNPEYLPESVIARELFNLYQQTGDIAAAEQMEKLLSH